MRSITSSLALLGMFVSSPPLASSQTGGAFAVVADAGAGAVHVLDLDAQALVGSVSIANPRDVRVSPDGSMAFVSDAGADVWVLDLTSSPPSIASGVNPIPTSNKAQGVGGELDLTADGRFLLMAGGSQSQFYLTEQLIVIDTAARAEVQAFEIGSDERGVSVNAQGDIAVITLDVLGPRIWSAEIDEQGVVTSDSDFRYVAFFFPQDVDMTPVGRTALGLSSSNDQVYPVPIPLDSFLIYPLAENPCGAPSFDEGASLVVHPEGDRFFARTVQGMGVTLESIAYDPVTRGVAAQEDWAVCLVDDIVSFPFVDRLVYDEPTDRIFALEQTRVRVLAGATGVDVASITDPAFVDLESIDAVVRRSADAATRNGTGINPLCLTTPAAPLLGGTWQADVDATVHPAPGVSFVEAHAGVLDPGIVLSFGELLVDIFDGGPLILIGLVSSGQTDTFTVSVPADLSLSGFELSAQAGVFGGGQTVLCNALDLRLGS